MLQVTLLGEQAITDDGAGVRAHSSRAVALVAFLVAHAGVAPAPAAHRRDVLAGLDGRAGADQPAPGTASPASGAGRRPLARRDAQGSVLARLRDLPR